MRTTRVERALLQRRVGNLGRVLAAIGGAFIVMRVVAVLAVGRFEHLLQLSMLTQYVAVALSLVLWLSCRSGEYSTRRIQVIEFGGLLLICSLYAVMAEGIPQAFRPEMTLLLGFGLFLLAHAIHVPSSWVQTVWLGATLAVPLIAGAWAILTPLDPRIVAASASAQDSVQTSETSIIAIGMASVITWWGVIVATAASASGVIYGLRREVRAAQQLGQYVLEQKLGEGGMGVVYRATHAMLRRATAVKLLLPDRVGEEALKRFEREVRSTAQLRHPNTVRIFDYGRTAEGLFYYAMELLEGASLAEIVEASGPLPPARAIHVMRQVAAALTEAHGLGLIHRDIKPANVMLSNQSGDHDHATVVDFGLVKRIEEAGDPSLSALGAIVGTPAYLAPEVLQGEGEDGVGRDLYALGCLAYYLLVGADVFTASTPIEVCAKHLSSIPEPPSRRLGQLLPEALEALVLGLLEKTVQARPPSALVVLERLESLATQARWTREDAARWWQGPGLTLLQRRQGADSEPGRQPASLSIDLHRRSGPKRLVAHSFAPSIDPKQQSTSRQRR